jgi:hypothetical protein
MPGELVLIYTGKEDTYREMFDELERGTMTHAALYEAMSGEAAPTALVEAEGRARAARAVAKADPSTGSERRSVHDPLVDTGTSKTGTGTPFSSLTEDEFMRLYCPSGWSYLYCWTSRTDDYWLWRTGYSMYTNLNTYRGSLIHELAYWSNGGWIIYVSRVVPQDYISYIGAWGVIIPRLTNVAQAGGDAYHLSIYGTD